MNRPAALAFSLILACSATLHAAPPDGAVAPATYDEASAGRGSNSDAEVEITRQLARRRGGHPEALAQIIQLSARCDDFVKAELIDELAVAHVRAGDIDLAAEARRVLAEKYPSQPQARAAVLWLVRLYASSEVSHAHRSQTDPAADIRRQLSPRLREALRSQEEGGHAPTTSAADASQEPADGANTAAPAATATEADAGAVYAFEYASRAVMANPGLAEDPALALQRSAAARRAGQLKSAQALLSPVKRRRAGDPWARCARAEQWLLEYRNDACPLPVAPCPLATTPPHLDGLLNEPCWQRETPAAATDPPATNDDAKRNQPPEADVRWAYDNKFLYVAIHCTKLAGMAYPHDDQPRPRDGDVEAHDHVRLLIDLDRDYGTWFELVVDSRGWTADGCWNDAAWNPQWFVAAADTEQEWTIEAAIPLAELTSSPLPEHAVWACAAQRLAPATSPPPTTDPTPEAFSLLLFD